MSVSSVKKEISKVIQGGSIARPVVINKAAFAQVANVAKRTSGVDVKERSIIDAFVKAATRQSTYRFDGPAKREATAFLKSYPLGNAAGAPAADVRKGFEKARDEYGMFLSEKFTPKTVADLPAGSDAAKRARSIQKDIDKGEASDTVEVLLDKKTGGLALFHPTDGESDYRLWTYTADGKAAGLMNADDSGGFEWDVP